jgi:hypothetical protein
VVVGRGHEPRRDHLMNDAFAPSDRHRIVA